ncbi:MAG: hypothetical protein ACLR23_15130 [Clostridia bacterium]
MALNLAEPSRTEYSTVGQGCTLGQQESMAAAVEKSITTSKGSWQSVTEE